MANKVTFKIEEHEIGPDNQLQDFTSKGKHLQESARMYVVLQKLEVKDDGEFTKCALHSFQGTSQLSLHVNYVLATLASYNKIKELNMTVSSSGSRSSKVSHQQIGFCRATRHS